MDRVRQLHYQRYEPDVSDHRPISAAFEMTVKSVRQDARAACKAEVQSLWVEEQMERLGMARAFYVEHNLM